MSGNQGVKDAHNAHSGDTLRIARHDHKPQRLVRPGAAFEVRCYRSVAPLTCWRILQLSPGEGHHSTSPRQPRNLIVNNSIEQVF